MLNIELPSDLTGYRHTCNGWFRREGMICGESAMVCGGLQIPTDAPCSNLHGTAISAQVAPSGNAELIAGVLDPAIKVTPRPAAISGRGRWG